MTTLPHDGLEQFYEAMATTLDELPEDQRQLFLAKVALYLASRLEDPQDALDAVAAGRAHLE